jgi:signal transduction histidine kinase
MSRGSASLETSVTFPGLVAIVPSARRFVRGILAGSARPDDMELITVELVSNAIRHIPSGEDGGEFTLMVRTEPGWARVEVSDTRDRRVERAARRLLR